MSVKVNEKGAWPKVCTDCEIELNPGVNCYLSMFQRGSYKCKTCKAKQSKIEHEKKWELPWFRDKKAEYLIEYHKKFDPAVYAIYYKLDIIYIGQSSRPQTRKTNHFSKNHRPNKKYWQGAIQIDLGKGILDRNHLSFDIIEYVNDPVKRLEREKYHLEQHKLAFGDYPKYNVYLTDKRKDS